MKQEKRIPSILGLLLLIAATIAGIYLNRSIISYRSKASSQCRPVNPQKTNITHQSFDLSFTTASNCSSSVSVNNRTIKNYQPSSPVHYFHIHNLDENQLYQFSIIINGTTYQQSDYNIETPPKPPGSTPASNLAWGKVFNLDNSPAAGAIIYFNIPGAAPLSSLVTTSGNWNISLATSLNLSKESWFTPPQNIEEEIIIISPAGLATQVTGNTSKNNPVPDIIIGQNTFDIPASSINQSGFSTPSSSIAPALNQSLEIKNPEDNESIFTQRPEFFGTAPKNSQVIITINSPQTFEGQTTSSSQGDWSWSPPQDLSPGSHSITVKSQDSQTGLWQTITHNFTVFASEDGSLSFDSSPSATIDTPTPSPSPTLPSSPTQTPSSSILPTTRAARPATDSGIPTSGFGLPTILSLSVAGILIITAYFLLI